MLKTFVIGIVLGALAAGGALYAVPLVDQHREASIIAVATNGGTSEAFHINIPMDRIMTGAPGMARPLPEGLNWPTDPMLRGLRTELFKVRNARDAVIGIAARTASEDAEGVIDWVIHIPARGSLFFNIRPEPLEGGSRSGPLRAGSREFSGLRGGLTERWVADTTGEAGAPAGRLELEARYLGEAVEEEVSE